MFKNVIKYILTFPQIFLLWLRGIKIDNYEKYVTFFRYIPFAWVGKDNIVSFFSEGKLIRMYVGNWHPAILAGIFGMKEYKTSFSDVKGKIIVDIGAAIGDTAVYFGMKGAKKIYGYEIIKECFDISQKNIELNNLKEICHMELCGIGKNDSIELTHPAITSFMSSENIKTFKGVKTKRISDIVREHDIKDAILKIDTDGFEYEILEITDNKTLRHFERIVIEYHYGIKNLEVKLQEAGFSTLATDPHKVYVDYHPEGLQNMEVGYIIAEKIGAKIS